MFFCGAKTRDNQLRELVIFAAREQAGRLLIN
jgi:hypothetical protein